MKKGALELSITAIVILIIAITILALGIGFIKKQFTAGTELVGGELTKIKSQMQEDMRTSGELLSLNLPEREVSIGKPQDLFIGVKNTLKNPNPDQNKVCFWLEVKCLNAFNPQNTCPAVVVGGVDSANNFEPITENNWFSSLLSKFDVKNFDAEVYPAEMLVRGAQPDRYAMEINVYSADGALSCSPTTKANTAPYASQSFTISVK